MVILKKNPQISTIENLFWVLNFKLNYILIKNIKLNLLQNILGTYVSTKIIIVNKYINMSTKWCAAFWVLSN